MLKINLNDSDVSKIPHPVSINFYTFGGYLLTKYAKTVQNLTKYTKMAEKLEDLNLPLTVVTRIVKEALPEGISISKEGRTGLAKAASVFVLYVTSAATNVVKNNKRKALTGQDVLEAMADIEFDRFVEPLREALEQYKMAASAKKLASGKKKDEVDDVEMVEDE